MTRGQKVVILILLAGHAACWISLRELWPFSPYPMYSRAFNPTEYNFLQLKAVSTDGNEWDPDVFKHFFPFWNLAFLESFLSRESEIEKSAYLREMTQLYQNRRTRMFPEWRELAKLRIYRITYNWERVRTSVKSGIRFSELAPDRKELLIESSAQ